MVIINFSDTKRQSFLRGFEKGLTAPILLYGYFQAPNANMIPQITVQPIAISEVLENDWKTIGANLRNAIERHGKEDNTKTTT